MLFEVDDVKEFSNIITVTEEYVPELRINADEDGLSFTALNQGHVVFINCNIKKEYFSTYLCDESVSFMVDTLEFRKALNRIKSDGTLTIELKDDCLELKHQSVGSNKTFKLNLISEMYDSPTPPPLEYPVSTVVDFNKFKEYVDDARLYTDNISFEFTNEGLEVSAGTDYARYHGVLALDEVISEYCRVVISADYLYTFLKLGLSEELYLDTGSDMPFNALVQSVDESLNYRVLVAPRLDDTER